MPKKRKVTKSKQTITSASNASKSSSVQKTSCGESNTVVNTKHHENSSFIHNSVPYEDHEIEIANNYYDSSDENILEEFNLYLSLKKKEESLKLKIMHEKLKREKSIKNKALLLKKTSEQRKMLDNSAKELKLKSLMSSNIQVEKILQYIFNGSKKEDEGLAHFTDEERKTIIDLLEKKKKINKEISQYQQEIANLEERCVKLNENIDNTFNNLMKKPTEIEKVSLTSEEEKELKQLESDNKKRNRRVQLLSRITVSLIESIEDKENLKDDLKVLADSCKRILEWDYEDVDEMENLCKTVYSTEI